MSDQLIRRQIAERLGYVVERQHYTTYRNYSGDAFYYLLDPNRVPVIPIDGRMQVMVDGKKVTVREYSREEWAWNDTPDWPSSVDAALTLPIDNWSWILLPMVEKADGIGSAANLVPWYTPPQYHDSRKTIWGRAGKGELALAMCRAWLEMKDREVRGE